MYCEVEDQRISQAVTTVFQLSHTRFSCHKLSQTPSYS